MARTFRRVPSTKLRDVRQVRDLEPVEEAVEAEPEPTPEPEPVPYADLQAQAKELDIPANQSREALEAAIAEASE